MVGFSDDDHCRKKTNTYATLSFVYFLLQVFFLFLHIFSQLVALSLSSEQSFPFVHVRIT